MPTPALRIEPLEDSQVDSIVALSLRAWAPVFDGMKTEMPAAAFAAFYPDGWQVRQRIDVTNVCQDPACTVWVALDDGAVTGFVATRSHSEDSMGEIYMIAVDPDRQRRGIGTALTDFALDRMREEGLSIALIETGADPGHAPARRSYEKSGFMPWPVVRYVREL